MNYRVEWPDDPLGELAAVWTVAPDRTAVTAAAHQIEQDLARDPYTRGIPAGSPQVRTAYEPPLGIDYEMIEDDKLVRILRVWSVV
jgi:hypothetical protein